MPQTPATILHLYREAFALYGARALWSYRPVASPSANDALVIARALKTQGDLAARSLADQIEEACRAAV